MNWKAFDENNMALMGRVIDAPLDVQKGVMELLSDYLEMSSGLALIALEAIEDAGFIIVPANTFGLPNKS